MRLVLALVAAIVSLSPFVARADCASRSSCVCSGAQTAVEGTVTSISGSQITVSVEAVDGDTSLASVGSSITTTGSNAKQGERWIAFRREGDSTWYAQMQVQSNGQISCYSQKDLVLSSADARAMSVASNCDAQFEERATAQKLAVPACNDTLVGCTSAGMVSALALLPLMLRRKRKS